MPEKAQFRYLLYAGLMAILVLISQDMSAQNLSTPGMAGTSGEKENKTVFIKDDPNDTSRWAKIRDIFQSSASRKEAAESKQLDKQNSEQEDTEADSKSIEKPKLMPRLRGIMSSGKNDTSALLNGYIAKKGDFIDGYTVKKIGNNSVTLEKNGKEYVLYVQQ